MIEHNRTKLCRRDELIMRGMRDPYEIDKILRREAHARDISTKLAFRAQKRG